MSTPRSLRWTIACLLVATACGGSDTAAPPAPPPVVATIRITAPRTIVEPGDSVQLVAQALTASGAVLPDVTFAWSTADTALVSVSAVGVVTGVAKGDAAIVATATGPSSAVKSAITATTQLNVRQLVRALTIVAPDTIAVGDTSLLKVIAYDARGAVIPNATVTWTSTDSQTVSIRGGQSAVGEDYGTVTLGALVTGPAEALTGLPSAPSATKRLAVRLVFSQIAGGAFHNCGVARNGVVHCWGLSYWGRLGTGIITPNWTNVLTPTAALTDVRFTSVDADEQRDSRSGHSCAVSADQSAYCWGSGAWGMLGDGKHGEVMPVYGNAFPTRVAGVPPVKQVALGASHTCLLDVGGTAWCAGQNAGGQVGVKRVGTDCDSAPCVLSFTRVSTSQQFQSLVAGGFFTCGLTVAGQAWCWGFDVPSFTLPQNPEIPSLVSAPVAFRSLAAGAMHACGLSSDGTAYCWGGNYSGEAGVGPSNTYPYWTQGPTRVVTAEHFASIVAGEYHTCALTVDGRAFCWGENDHGQLGSSTTEMCGDPSIPNAVVAPCSSVPRPVSSPLRFVGLALGWQHTCGLTSRGEAYCWGSNDNGQLGTGDTSPHLTPAKVLSER
jgi:alpha-tubulin suppressor-like RCC1 family protein